MDEPTGTVTFLFTDIEGSSRLWERFPVDMGPALARHDAILRGAIESHGGLVFKTVGDAFCAAFPSPASALSAALSAQAALFSEDWGAVGPLRVRMGLHVGPAEFRDHDYFGGTLNRTARISSAGHGGQILVSQAVADQLREWHPDVRFAALGDFRLRNLQAVERIFQVRAPGLPATFPPLRSQLNLPHNLPAATTTFIGRSAEVEQAKALLLRTRLLTLLGTGGTGKTRLAIEVGREMQESYPEGVWLVELATIDQESDLDDAIASALGVREEPGRRICETLAGYICEREVLLILDNCEHILASVARSVTALLSRCRNLHILTTSRQALGVPGEVTLPLGPLAAFDVWKRSRDNPVRAADIAGFDAVKLFLDRAQAVVPAFALTDQNAPDIARICWRLDGIPLALELAAARLRVLSPSQISDRLNDQFSLIKGRAGLPHQQTLRTLIDWSYDLLSPPEKRLFQRLGVFAGGRTIEAVEDVCEDDGEDLLDLLQQLADKSLISMDHDERGGTRYNLLESVWQYAREKLAESGEMAELQERHLAYFLRRAEEAAPMLSGSDPAPTLRSLASELLNLRFALEWAAERPGGAEPGLRLLAALERYWEICGNLEEARRQCEAILARPDVEVSQAALAAALICAGRIAWTQDRYDEGRASLGRAMTIFDALGNLEQSGLAHGYAGFLAFSDGHPQLAADYFLRARELGERTGKRKLLALSLAGEGSLAAAAGDSARALELKREALEVFRLVGDKWIVGYSLWGLAQAALAQDDAGTAHSALSEWSQTARELGNRWAVPYILQLLADTARLRGNPELAARLFGAAEMQREKLGIRFTANEAAAYEKSLEKLRGAIEAAALQTHWNAGRHLKPAAALELGLGLGLE